ncbi:hypothetical protein [Polynucleobacter necessarius]|uniref:hypothetical protein n=1 Tax=Polynucleobacter necessarius TaxID=576610 RepID=UPI001E30A404|nr:hypothetical protein [Polynucleobacter necessarius]
MKMIEQYTMSLNEFSEKFKSQAKEGASPAELKSYLNTLLQEGFPGLAVDEASSRLMRRLLILAQRTIP